MGGSRRGLKVRGLSGAVSALSGLSGGSIRGAGGTHPLLDGGDGSVRRYSFFSDRMVHGNLLVGVGPYYVSRAPNP